MKDEEIRQNQLKEDRITVHSGEFRIEKRTDDTHSLTPEEYRQQRLRQLEEMKKMLKKKEEPPIKHIR